MTNSVRMKELGVVFKANDIKERLAVCLRLVQRVDDIAYILLV